MQIDYSTSLDSGALVLGQVYDNSLAQVDGFMAEEDISFGAPVVRGTTVNANNSTSAPLVKTLLGTTSPAGKYIGIAIRDINQPVGGVLATAAGVGNGTDKAMTTITTALESYPIGAGVSVMRLGRVSIMIPTGTTMTNSAIGATVVFSPADGVITFTATSSDDSSTAINLGTLVTVATAGQLAVIQVNKLL